MARVITVADSDFSTSGLGRLDLAPVEQLAGSVTSRDTGLSQQFACCHTADGRGLYLAGVDQKLRLLDLTTGALSVLADVGGETMYLALSADGRTLYLAQHEAQRIMRYNTRTGELLVLAGGVGPVTGIATEPSGRWLYYATHFGNLGRVNLQTLSRADLAPVPSTGAMGLAYSAARGELIAVTAPIYQSGAPSTVWRANPDTGLRVNLVAGPESQSVDGDGHTVGRINQPYGIAVGNRGKYAYITGWEGHTVRRLDLDTGLLSTLAGGVYGTANGLGAAAQFARPAGISFFGDELRVTHFEGTLLRQIV